MSRSVSCQLLCCLCCHGGWDRGHSTLHLFIGVVSGLCSSAWKALINNGCVCAGVSCMDCHSTTCAHKPTRAWRGIWRLSFTLPPAVRPAHGVKRCACASGDGGSLYMCMCGECEVRGSLIGLVLHNGCQNEIYLWSGFMLVYSRAVRFIGSLQYSRSDLTTLLKCFLFGH